MSKWDLNWPMTKLGDIISIDNKVIQPEDIPDDCTYIGLEDIEKDTGAIIASGTTIAAEVKSTKFMFTPEHILYGKLRPNLNKVAIPDCHGICSTDIYPILVNDGVAIKGFVAHVLRGPQFVKYASSRSTGANLPRINGKTILDYEIPLPPLETQKQIAQTLDTAAELHAMRKQQLAELDNVIVSVFHQMFGDMAFNEHEWNERRLVDICRSPDDMKCGPFGTQLSKDEYQSSGVPLWGIPQVNADFQIPAPDFLTEEKAGYLEAYSIVANDITMSRKGNVGRCALYPTNFPKGIMHSDVLRIRVNQETVNPLFMFYQLHLSRHIKNQVELVSGGAIMAGVNVTRLKNITVHVPPLPLQTRFAEIATKSAEQKNLVKKAITEAQQLFDSLMSVFFE